MAESVGVEFNIFRLMWIIASKAEVGVERLSAKVPSHRKQQQYQHPRCGVQQHISMITGLTIYNPINNNSSVMFAPHIKTKGMHVLLVAGSISHEYWEVQHVGGILFTVVCPCTLSRTYVAINQSGTSFTKV